MLFLLNISYTFCRNIIWGLRIFAKNVAEGIKRAFPCIKVGQAVLGLEVPHAHIHLVPMQSEKDMRFTNPKLKLTPEEFKEIAEKTQSKIAVTAISLCVYIISILQFLLTS